MGLIYRFPSWTRVNVDSELRPSRVKKYFDRREVYLTREAWRKLLRPRAPYEVRISTWAQICEATGEPLSAFIEYVPTGDLVLAPAVRRKPKASPAHRKPSTPDKPEPEAIPNPPDPRAFLGGGGDD